MLMQLKLQHLLFGLLILLFAAAVVVLNDPPRPECSGHTFRPTNGNGGVLDPVTIPLVGGGTNVPEYNDCQALIENGKYGPIVAVFARQVWFPRPDTARWHLFAVLFNFGKLGAPTVRYNALSIEWGFSCLYLPVTRPIVSAYLHSNGSNETCAPDISPPVANLEARVRVKQVATDPVPKAARWEWDDNSKVQYIGLACGRGEWCDVGQTGFQSTAMVVDWSAKLPAGVTEGPAHRIRAYLDEQELAITNSAEDEYNPVVMGTVRGVFAPAPNLATLNEAQFEAEYQYVGTMVIDQTHQEYSVKFGLTPDEPTHVYLKRTPILLPGAEYFMQKQAYTAEFRTGTNIIRKRYWGRRHPGMPPSGMVRWRWSWDDETTWVQCLQGCCSTQ